MKRVLIFLTIPATALLFGACDKHSWTGEDGQLPTKDLFQEHGGDGHADDDGHKPEGGDKVDHGKKDAEKAQH